MVRGVVPSVGWGRGNDGVSRREGRGGERQTGVDGDNKEPQQYRIQGRFVIVCRCRRGTRQKVKNRRFLGIQTHMLPGQWKPKIKISASKAGILVYEVGIRHKLGRNLEAKSDRHIL